MENTRSTRKNSAQNEKKCADACFLCLCGSKKLCNLNSLCLVYPRTPSSFQRTPHIWSLSLACCCVAVLRLLSVARDATASRSGPRAARCVIHFEYIRVCKCVCVSVCESGATTCLWMEGVGSRFLRNYRVTTLTKPLSV